MLRAVTIGKHGNFELRDDVDIALLKSAEFPN
jgi:hypothetical protein